MFRALLALLLASQPAFAAQEPLRVAVTGASSGLGRAVALQLGAEGHKLVLIGRDEARLTEVQTAVALSGGQALVLPLDVTDAAAVKQGYEKVQEAYGGLDWLVLNAGVGGSNDAKFFDGDVYKRTFETNVGGAVNWLHVALPGMVKAGRGKVAGISSLAAFKGLPGSGPYSASKAALSTMLESARVDLRGTGVEVVTIHPGFIRTPMNTDKQPFIMEVDDAARRVIAAIRGKGQTKFPFPLSFLSSVVLPRVPDWLYDRAATAEKPKGLVRVLIIGTFANLAIAAAKLTGAAFSGSSAMLAEGIHSAVDTLNKLFLWFGISFSKKAATPEHPFGFAREGYFWTLIVALAVFFLGSIVSIYEGLHKFFEPEPLSHVGWTFGILFFSLAAEAYSGWVGLQEYRAHYGDKPFFKTARESKDLGVISTIIEDAIAAAGVLTAIVGLGAAVLFDLPWLDGVTSIAIGVILGAAALFLAAETKGLLIGEGASKADLIRIRSAVTSVPRVLDIVDLDTEHRGPEELLVIMRLKFAPHLTVAELEATVDAVEKAVRKAVPSAKHISIEAGSFKPGD